MNVLERIKTNDFNKRLSLSLKPFTVDREGYHTESYMSDREAEQELIKLAEFGQRMQWQPIETAPKDGQKVDLWCKRSWDPPETHERRTNVYWDKWHKTWRTVGNEHYIENTFKSLDNIYDYRYLIPTHWIPIPPQP